MGFFNNMYYGKANKADFTPENLPKNRVALYFEMLRIHLTGLINVNLCFLLTALPALIWLFINMTALGNTISAAESYDAVTLLSQVNGVVMIFLIGLIPCSLLLGPGICGMVNVTKQWACDDHAWVWSDFWHGFKDNWKQGMLVGLVDSVGLLLVYFALLFYTQMAAQSMVYFVLQIVIILLTVVFFMANLYVFPLMVTYKLTFGQLWRNALLLALGRLPFSVLFGIFLLLPPALMLIVPNGIFMMIMVILYLLILFAWQAFTITSYTNASFDKIINPHLAGVTIGKGMRKAEDDWDDDDEDEEEDIDAEFPDIPDDEPRQEG